MCVYAAPKLKETKRAESFWYFFFALCSFFFLGVVVKLLIPPVSFRARHFVLCISSRLPITRKCLMSFHANYWANRRSKKKTAVLITSTRFIYGMKGIRLIHRKRNDRQELRCRLPYVLYSMLLFFVQLGIGLVIDKLDLLAKQSFKLVIKLKNK